MDRLLTQVQHIPTRTGQRSARQVGPSETLGSTESESSESGTMDAVESCFGDHETLGSTWVVKDEVEDMEREDNREFVLYIGCDSGNGEQSASFEYEDQDHIPEPVLARGYQQQIPEQL